MTINTNNYASSFTLPPMPSGVAPVEVADAKPVNAPGAGAANATQGSLSAPSAAGELPYDMASVNGIDWNDLTNDLATTANLSVSINEIMLLLIQVMAQMRQDQREVALADAQNALQSGLNAAEKMKDAAVASLVSGIITNAASMAMAGMTMSQSASQMKSLQGAKTELNNAEKLLQEKQAALKEEAPEANKATSQKAVEAAVTGKKAADAQMDLVTKQVNVQSNRTQGLGQLMQSTAGLLGGLGNFVAESARAEAKAYESQAQYEQSMQQADQAFFQQLGDAIRNMMQNWQSIESATHQANQAIYNV